MRFPKRSPFPATGNCAKLLKFNANFYSHFLGLFGCVAISDDESSDVDAHLPVASWRDDDEVEARPARKAAAAKPATVDVEDDEDEEEDEDDDGGDDVYVGSFALADLCWLADKRLADLLSKPSRST